jgi:hypothetical protein
VLNFLELSADKTRGTLVSGSPPMTLNHACMTAA